MKYQNIISSIMGELWLIKPEKLTDIMHVIEVAQETEHIDSIHNSMRSHGILIASNQKKDEVQVVDGVQVIDVLGTLSPRMNMMTSLSGGKSTEMLAAEVRAAGANPDVKSVLLRIDSPGGAASFVPEAAMAIREVAKSKRVVAAAQNMMASGAFWIGAAATEVYASPSTEVGSVGVFTVMQNVKKAAEDKGVKFLIVRAGSLKAAGNPYEEWSTEQIASLQKRVNDIYVNFISALADFRGVSSSSVEETFGQGTVFLAAEAQQRKMIDGVLTFDEVLAKERSRSTRRADKLFAGERKMKFSAKAKAAMLKAGLIESTEADDDTCLAAAQKYMGTQHVNEDVLVGMLAAVADAQSAAGLPPAPPVAASRPSMTPEDINRVAAKAMREERARVADIRARGKLMPHVTDAMIEEAVTSDISAEKAVEAWVQIASKAEANRSPITAGPAQADVFANAASEVLLSRLGSGFRGDEKVIRESGASLRHARMLDIARISLQSAGGSSTGDPEEDALAFLKLSGEGVRVMRMEDGGTVNRRGDHPSLLDLMANKAIQQAYPIAATKFDQWAYRLPDLSDFKPSSFIETGIFTELDMIMEDEKSRELKFSSALVSWYKIDRYSNKVGLTVEMIVDDNLGGFGRMLGSLGSAPARTLNTLCLNLLTSNPNLMDGIPLFHASHGNLVTGGAAPSSTSASIMRTKHRLMVGYSGQVMDEPPSIALLPASLEQDAKQVFMTNMYDGRVAQTDSAINTIRGEITPIIDARLDAFSTTEWYTMVNPNILPVIAYAYMRGYGADGRRTSWFENERKCRWIDLEARFCAAIVGFRGMVKMGV